MLIVDIGGTTTDMSIINGVGAIDRQHTSNLGVFDIVNELSTKLIEKRKAKTLPRASVDTVLRTGTYRDFNCLDMIKASSQKVMRRILNQVNTYEADEMAFDHILYVGGGAALIGEDLAEAYGNRARSHIPDNPDLAIARGLIKSELARQLPEDDELEEAAEG